MYKDIDLAYKEDCNWLHKSNKNDDFTNTSYDEAKNFLEL